MGPWDSSPCCNTGKYLWNFFQASSNKQSLLGKVFFKGVRWNEWYVLEPKLDFASHEILISVPMVNVYGLFRFDARSLHFRGFTDDRERPLILNMLIWRCTVLFFFVHTLLHAHAGRCTRRSFFRGCTFTYIVTLFFFCWHSSMFDCWGFEPWQVVVGGGGVLLCLALGWPLDQD